MANHSLNSAKESLFERIGGGPAVSATVAKLYDKILSDPLLVSFFEGINVEHLRHSQKAFVSVAMGANASYTGENLALIHKKLVQNKGLTDIHFDAVLQHLDDALEELGIPEHLRSEALFIVEGTRNTVLNR